MAYKSKAGSESAKQAAEKYRILQAERLIRSARVEVKTGGRIVKVPVFVLADPKTRTYKMNPILEEQEADKAEKSNG